MESIKENKAARTGPVQSPRRQREVVAAGEKWVVRVGVQDYDGEWWDREYQVDARDCNEALESGCDKAREANRYAQAVRPYCATLAESGRVAG